MNKFDIKIPIYNCVCHVVISEDIEKVINRYAKRLKWNKDVLIAENCQVHGYFVTTGELKDYYVFYSKASLNINIISHEISHLIDEIFSDRSIEANGETRAYLTGYVTEQIFDYIMKKDLLINKYIKNQKVKDEKSSGLLREVHKDSQGVEERTS